MLDSEMIRRVFEQGLEYEAYVAAGTPEQVARWKGFEEGVSLSEAQTALIGGFTRRMNIVVSSGVWCGDCVQQVPFVKFIEGANPEMIRVRVVDRDEQEAFAKAVMINGGMRVPVAVFANEDFEFVSLFGDRSLARYRAMAAKKLGGACPLPGADVPSDEVAATFGDWVDEFERVQLLLRLSAKLCERYGD